MTGANQPNTPSNLPHRRLLCEELLPVPGSTLTTQGLRGDFAVMLLEPVPRLAHARLAQPLTSAVTPNPAQEHGEKSQHLQRHSSAHHSTSCPARGGSLKLSSSLPPSSGAFYSSVLTNSTSGALLLSHGMGI